MSTASWDIQSSENFIGHSNIDAIDSPIGIRLCFLVFFPPGLPRCDIITIDAPSLRQ